MRVNLARAYHYDGLARVRELRNQLSSRKMELDKEFTLHLDKNNSKMKENTIGNVHWAKYHTMLKEYEYITGQIKVADYYITRG